MLDVALQYAGRGWAVFPLSSRKIPFKGSHGHRDASTDPAQLEALWTGRTVNGLGLATGAIVVIDPDGASAVQRLQEIGAAHGGWPRTLTAKTPRSIHLYYRAPAGVEIRSRNEPRAHKGADGIDIKGHGGYVVLPPSYGTYQWVIEQPPTELPAWAVEWIRSLSGSGQGIDNAGNNSVLLGTPLPAHLQPGTTQNSQHHQSLIGKRLSAALGTPWSLREEQRVREALATIPATGYDRWLALGMALHALDWERSDGTSIGFDLWNDWSATAPDLYALDACEKKWESFGRTGRSGVTLGTLYHIAEQHGWQGLVPQVVVDPPHAGATGGIFSPAAVSAAGVQAAPYMNGHASAAAVLPDGLVRPSDLISLQNLNNRYACIGDVGGKCMVMGWVPAKSDPAVEVPSFQSFKSFAERYGNIYVTVTKDVKEGAKAEEAKQIGAYWLKWRNRRTYDAIDLIPGAPPVVGNTLNLWRGLAVPPAKGTWERLKNHIAEVLADGDATALDYIMRWSAWAVQHPDKRAESALVFRGSKGSGKGTFAHAMRRLFGAHGLHISNSKHLVGAFNAHLRNCLLLYSDEAFWAGDKQGESTLKALITEPTLTIEQKGVDAVQWHNRIHLIMTANAEWVVPASHDERRYAMFNVSEKYLDNTSYFEKLHREIEDGGLAAMLYDLQHVELGDWHPRKIVKTQALTEQKIQSMTPLQEWWENLLQDGVIPAAPKEAPDCVMAVHLLNHAREFAPRLRDLNASRLGRFLSDHGCIKLHRNNGNAWRFAPLEKQRADWTKRYGGWAWETPTKEWGGRV